MQIPDMMRSTRIATIVSFWAILFLGSRIGNGQAYFVMQDNGAFDLVFESPTDVTINDNSTEELPIGFDFTFFGNTYTTCHLS